jgi:hypothetical protein
MPTFASDAISYRYLKQQRTLGVMGRGAVAISVQADSGVPVRLVTTHLQSKLLTFPGGRFQPRDENERARFAAYALYRRTARPAGVLARCRSWQSSFRPHS